MLPRPFNFACLLLLSLGFSRANRPPQIRCPRVPRVYTIETGRTDIRVIWAIPQVMDPEGGWLTIHLTTPQHSGSLFTQGRHTVTYEVEDNGGLKSSCSFSFIVEALECPRLSLPSNSKRYSCTNDLKVGSVCWLECDESRGYAPVRGQITGCSPSRTWTNVGMECVDIEKPQIENCPTETIVQRKDPSSHMTSVTWEKPITVSDNSGEQIEVKSLSGFVTSTGGMFMEGTTLVKLMARDRPGNSATMCAFNVKVVAIECDPPTFDDQYLSAGCSDLTEGQVCRLQCDFALKLRGPRFIQCKRSTKMAVNAKGFWSYGQDNNPPAEAPYCEVPKCPALGVPTFGAMVCSEWDGKATCQLSCRGSWDIPASVDVPSLYICDPSTNTWNSDNVPDCEWLEGQRLQLSRNSYYAGSCATARNEIKTKFVAVVKDNGKCPPEGFCTVEHVDVQCGDEPQFEWKKK